MMPRVLIVDKEKFWREMSQVALKSKGYRVDLLNDYSHLLKKTISPDPDVILIGFTAIGKCEEEIIEHTIKLYPRAIVLVLSTSWLIPQSVERRLLRLGVANVMGRPGNGSDLVGLVADELKAEREELASLSSYARFRLRGAA